MARESARRGGASVMPVALMFVPSLLTWPWYATSGVRVEHVFDEQVAGARRCRSAEPDQCRWYWSYQRRHDDLIVGECHDHGRDLLSE
jgi:hypothetical protein